MSIPEDRTWTSKTVQDAREDRYHMSSNGGKHQITFDVLDPSEAREGLERCRVFRDYALKLESAMACSADTDDENDEEATKHKKKNAKEAADEILLNSAIRGAASSGDRPLEPGIVARGEVRTIAYDLTKKMLSYDDEAKDKASEQGSEEPIDTKCKKCNKDTVPVRANSLERCTCEQTDEDAQKINEGEGADATPDKDAELLDDLAIKLRDVCQECKYCKGRITEPCLFLSM